MKVYFVGAGPGDPELLTVKAKRLLEIAGCCIWAGSLINPGIMELVPPDAEIHNSAGLTLDQTLGIMASARDRDCDVVRLHTGEPSIYGAIGEQMRGLEDLGIDYEIVPGISSFQAAAATLRRELTAPEIAQTVVLTRMPGRTPMPERESLQHLAPIQATLCLFLSTGKIADVARELTPEYGADCPACVVYHASWPDELVVVGTLEDIARRVADAGLTKTAIILIGRALGDIATVSKLYDRSFSHEYRSKLPAPPKGDGE
jgi:precorrin-4/cobalt-precorrin-4 C11-methyltransferase